MEQTRKISKTIVEDFSIANLSSNRSTRKKSEYECNKNLNTKITIKRNLSKVENYAEFDFRAGRKTSVELKKPEIKTEISVKVEEPAKVATVVKEKKEKSKTAVAKKTCSSKKATSKANVKSEYEVTKYDVELIRELLGLTETSNSRETVISEDSEIVVVKADAPAKFKEREDEFRQSSVVAVACDRDVCDDAAERIVSIARMGALFDCVTKIY